MGFNRLCRYSYIALACCVSAGISSAANFSFTGTFATDDQLQIFTFTAPSASVTLRTWSYAGGNDAAGDPIPAGGFDPVLTVFNATGGLLPGSLYVDSNDDGAGVAQDPPFTGNGFDSLLVLTTLLPGDTYALVLSQNDNLAVQPTFGDGFTQTGQSNFTPGEFGCGGTQFCDQSGAQRNGNWEVDILGVGTASPANVPEPGSILLLTTGLAAVTLVRRRKQHSQA